MVVQMAESMAVAWVNEKVLMLVGSMDRRWAHLSVGC